MKLLERNKDDWNAKQSELMSIRESIRNSLVKQKNSNNNNNNNNNINNNFDNNNNFDVIHQSSDTDKPIASQQTIT